MPIRLPNLLTLSRILVIPALVGAFHLRPPWSDWAPLTLFLLASVTDWLDGYVARSWNQLSSLGRFLDPIADKLLIATTILMLVALDRIAGWTVLAALVILLREILPNVWGPVIVTATMNVGWAILATAALGFIGVGAQPPHPEWGLMISEGRDYLISNWYLSTLPGTAMFMVVLSLILFGDGLRDSLDPTLRHQ